MYFVDRNKISETLAHMSELLALFEEKNGAWEGLESRLALERLALNTIESIIDVGNTMIDGFIMRDPGSYDDIIDILVDEKVIPAEMDAPLKDVISVRKMLVREFMKIDQVQIQEVFARNLHALKEFRPKVEHYVEHELGAVSAFLPEGNNESI